MPRKKTLDSAVTDLVQALRLLARHVHGKGEPCDLSWTQAIVMKRLATGGPATIAELARAEGMKPQSMGTTIAALEKLGMVKRTPHPTDGRQMHVELTAKGATVRERAVSASRAWLTQAIAHLSKDDQETLFAAGEIVRRMVQS